jgi:5-(carboxyamino)imidazole ribonucleotide mutase
MFYRVGIVMGSDSDLPIMQEASKTLSEFGIESEMRVISAHRTPKIAAEYAENASGRLNVIIAGAGGAAHLAGVMAASTSLPVIGVPIRSAALNGLDSLLSTVQMPSGIPVATVAIDGAKNAAILAAQMIGTVDESMRKRVEEYKLKLAENVMAKDAKLQK